MEKPVLLVFNDWLEASYKDIHSPDAALGVFQTGMMIALRHPEYALAWMNQEKGIGAELFPLEADTFVQKHPLEVIL